jgi:adenine-specific DNA-methyltransferase
MNPFNRKIYYPPVNRIWRRSKKYIWDELNKMGVLFREDENGNLVVDGSFDLEYAKKKLEEKKYPRIFFGEHGTTGPRYLQYLSEIAGKGRKMSTYWHAEDLCDDAFSMLLPHTIVDHNANATKLIYEIMGRDNAFNTPKPLKLTEMLIELFCPNDGNVLDCFAGSGTTGHAVLSTNKKLNRNRSFILVEKADYIESLTLERLNRVINGNWAKGQVDPLGGEVIYKEHNNEPSKNL